MPPLERTDRPNGLCPDYKLSRYEADVNRQKILHPDCPVDGGAYKQENI